MFTSLSSLLTSLTWQPGKSGKVSEFDLQTWKFTNGIKHPESHGMSLMKITRLIYILIVSIGSELDISI